LKSLLTYKNINAGLATHVVAEITWGAYTVVTAKHQLSKKDAEAETDIGGSLKANLVKIQLDISGKGGYQGKEGHHSSDYNFDVQVHGDFLADDGALPTTFGEAYKFLTKVPQYIFKANEGKGKPVTYTLLPLAMLKWLFNIEIAADTTLLQLGMDTHEKFVQLFDEYREAQLKLFDYQTRIKEHRFCIPAEHIKKIDDLKHDANVREAALKSRYAVILKDVRSGKAEADKLWKLREEFNTGGLSPGAIEAASNEYTNKMDYVDMWTGKGAKYIGFNSGVESLKNVLYEVYVFRFNWNAQHQQPAFKENVTILQDLLDREIRVVVIDCDGTGEAVEKPYICHNENGAVITEDLAEERRELANECIMQYSEAFVERGQQKRPIKMARVKLPCPGKNCSPGTRQNWICSKCRGSVSFAYSDSFLYCDCGRCLYKHWSFHCKEPKHGLEWPKYQDPKLLSLLNALEPFDALNILILGETGVGKSTFINAFVNYLTFDTLAEAMKEKELGKPLNCIIPFSFATQVVDKNDPRGRFIQTTVRTLHPPVSPWMIFLTNNPQVRAGASDNEHDGSKGQSATQKTLVHSVQIGSYTVRLFDTPGIGDTRGASQDAKNMADILSVLSNYEKLHGVLILLKPNNSRLTIMFKFCIKELLTHLHRDATQNMVFGFTNTRGANYKPGDTFQPLENELKTNKEVDIGLFESTVYCFDSESFRHLAAYHQGVDLGDFEDYSRSWEYSSRESRRLLTHFMNLTPHRVKSTVSLNETRHMITELTKPMAEIQRTMKITIKMNEEQIASLCQDKLKKEDLEKGLYTSIVTLQAHKLDQPRTVCSHVDCVDYKKDGNVLKTVYKTLCHNPCHLDNVPADRIAHPDLIKCAAIDGNTGNCYECKHSWQLHLHVLYELKPEQRIVKHPEVVERLKAATTELELKQIAIAEKTELIKEIESEHDQIERAAIQFCLFLKKNSITPYNDATLEYLGFLIDEEQGKVHHGQKRDKLDALLQYRDQYKEQVRILSTRLAQGDGSVLLSEQEVQEKIKQLYVLKNYGQDLQQIKTIVSKAHSETFREQSHHVRVRGKHWDLRGALAGGYKRLRDTFASNITAL
jgi:GTPase SAR1 family protein